MSSGGSVLISRGLAISLVRALRLSSPLHSIVLASRVVQVVVPLDPLQELEVVLVLGFDQLLHVDVLVREKVRVSSRVFLGYVGDML